MMRIAAAVVEVHRRAGQTAHDNSPNVTLLASALVTKPRSLAMNPTRRSILIAGSMAAVAAATAATRHALADGQKASPPQLVRIVPREFAGWRELATPPSVVSAQTQEMLQSIYNEILARVYAASDGYQVMLSIAYGGDQRGVLRAHKPEVCYPAQGFKLEGSADGVLSTDHGPIPMRTLRTVLGPRNEPVMYWFAYAGRSSASAWERRLQGLRLALTGQVPDGLLFRVSSIDADAQRAWGRQGDFVRALLGACTPLARTRLAGLAAVA
jgi:EpsI family protein